MPRYEDTAPALAEAAKATDLYADDGWYSVLDRGACIVCEADATLIAAHSPDVVRALAEVVGAARAHADARTDYLESVTEDAALGRAVDDAHEALTAALARLDAATGGGR